MNVLRKTIHLSLLLVMVSACQNPTNKALPLDINSLMAEFSNPSNEYRAKPFWAWNGELEEEELIRQIHLIKEMGFGGFFMHSRTGLKTEYLGEKWFEITKACADEAQQLGLEAWLYDEDRWPSGLAGGLVTENPDFRMQYVSLYTPTLGEFSWTDTTLAVFTCLLDSVSVSNVQKVQKGEQPKLNEGETLLVFVNEKMAPWSFYNGYTYLNTLKREATDKFIEVTHQKYKEVLDGALGTSIEGIFTDEPHNGCVFGGFGMQNSNAKRMTTWTDEFASTFTSRFGYDITDSLPGLFYLKDGKTFSQVKWHYMEHCEQLYLDNFSKPVLEWCQANKMKLTGHALHENTLMNQAIMQGSLMRNYEYFTYPGIDFLTENAKPFWIAKQLTSVGRQLEKPFMLTETYGVTGWQTNFESYKAIGDWQALYGINLRCPHLSWYTMQGEAKRDYPASIFYQSAWWQEYKYIEDYYARLGFLLSQGKPKCDLLVINPVESLWGQIHTGWANGLNPTGDHIQKLEDIYENTFNWLQQARIDFDYADEEMLSRYVKHTSKNGKPLLEVGAAQYSTVLVSGMETIRSSTLAALKEFAQAGGTVIFTGQAPAYIDALPSDEVAAFAGKSVQVAFQKDEFVSTLSKYAAPLARVTDGQGNTVDDIFCQARIDGDRQTFVLMNTNRRSSFMNLQVELPVEGAVSMWDCKTGKVQQIEARQESSSLLINLDFYPISEYVLMVTPEPLEVDPAPKAYKVDEQVGLDGPFDYQLSEPNLCVLDLAEFSIDGQPMQALTEILKIDQAIRNNYGLPHREGKMVQPWFRAKYGPAYFQGGKIRLSFPFYIDVLPTDTAFLALETPNLFDIHVNNQKLIKDEIGWHIDHSIRKILLPVSMLRKGENRMELEFTFTEDMELEAMYLGGNFGVKLDGTKKSLVALPEKMAIGDIVPQGLPFYSGKITYLLPVPGELKGSEMPTKIEVGKFQGALVKIKAKPVQSAQVIAWAPYESILQQMGDTVEVELVLTRRNTFGPLHLLPNRPQPIGPPHFITTGDRFSNDYQLFPAGLMDVPVLSKLTIE